MSTLEYLDESGTVNFRFVPGRVLHNWLSALNCNPHVAGTLRDGVNRGNVLEELEDRRKGHRRVIDILVNRAVSDWREYENEQGYTHLEELLIYQPEEWRKQAREYLYRYDFKLERVSSNAHHRTVQVMLTVNETNQSCPIFLKCPTLVVLFHPDLKRSWKYQPLNFLLAYGVQDPLPGLDLEDDIRSALVHELSPLDYFFYFQQNVQSSKMSSLRAIGEKTKVPRLWLIKELDFSDIVGQRMAKDMIRSEIEDHSMCRLKNKGGFCKNQRPISMLFAGPSGNGKTEMAHWLAELLNKPGDDAFLKVDCGKLSHASEVFGMSGAYQGANEGSALNNFVLRMSLDPDALGIVLLDEIEKADQSVIHGLYQVIDKGEWTNKKLERGHSQTATIPCHNLIFIMTTNAADKQIIEFSSRKQVQGIVDSERLEEATDEIENIVQRFLQHSRPFTEAFIGRIGKIVPFFPMTSGDLEENLLMGEMMVIAKLLIEREQERLTADGLFQVDQVVSAKEKHRMARIIVSGAVPEAGVRSIQKGIEKKMGKRMRKSLLLEKGGIKSGAQVRYFTDELEKKINYQVQTSGNQEDGGDEVEDNDEDDYDVCG